MRNTSSPISTSGLVISDSGWQAKDEALDVVRGGGEGDTIGQGRAQPTSNRYACRH